jgi:hypothetical protein
MTPSDPVERFRIAARGYCERIDVVEPGQEREELVRGLHPLVTEVYAAGLSLSPLPGDDNDPEAARLTQEDWKKVYDRLCAVLERRQPRFCSGASGCGRTGHVTLQT